MRPDDPALLARLRQDPRDLIEGCFSVQHPETQASVPFLFRPEQDTYWKARTQMDVILKSRQRGFSKLIGAEWLAACILNEREHAVIVAHREEDTQLLLAGISWMKDQLPFEVPVAAAGAGHLHFKQTDSDLRIITAGSKEGGRSRRITRLHLSERAFYPKEDFLAAVEGACSETARRVIETTANGHGTPFHKFWLQTKAGRSAYRAHFFPWWVSPELERDLPPGGLGDLDDAEKALREAYTLSDQKLAWRRWKISTMSTPALFPREYPANEEEAFLASGRMVFDWVALQRLTQAARAPKWIGRLRRRGDKVEVDPHPSGELTIWETPREDRRYLISADVAEGLPNGAWSVADVLDASSWEQVAQWRGHVAPHDFGDVMGDLGAYYNWALVCPEVNNHGMTTCARLRAAGYPNLYSREDERRPDTDFGWETNKRTRLEMVNGLAHSVKNLEIKVNSPATLDELKGFVYDERGESSHQQGGFSDCVISLAIGAALLGLRRESVPTQRRRFREAMGLPPLQPAYRPKTGGYGRRA